MIRFIVIICFGFILSGCEGTLRTAIIADAITTSQFQHVPEIHETNKLLGENPSNQTTLLYFTGAIILHHLILKALPDEYDPYWTGIFTAYYSWNAYHNMHLLRKYDD